MALLCHHDLVSTFCLFAITTTKECAIMVVLFHQIYFVYITVCLNVLKYQYKEWPTHNALISQAVKANSTSRQHLIVGMHNQWLYYIRYAGAFFAIGGSFLLLAVAVKVGKLLFCQLLYIILLYESSTLTIYKELSGSIFRSL